MIHDTRCARALSRAARSAGVTRLAPRAAASALLLAATIAPAQEADFSSFDPPAALPFGTKGTSHLVFYSGAAIDLEEEDDAVDVPLVLGYSTFIAEDVEFSLELGLFGHFQEGDDAAGFNPGFNFRYHFINRRRWSVFFDAGIGLIFSTDNVPDGGTGVNFTPRAGLGGTYQLNASGLRLLGGLRWHHISNARVEGEERNPDRDGILFYAGLTFPF